MTATRIDAFLRRTTDLSDRFMTERSFELIVAPALADLQFDAEQHDGRASLRSYLAVIVAFGGAVLDEAIQGGTVWTFAGLTCIPAVYYLFFFMLGAPEGLRHLEFRTLLVLGGALVLLSVGPVIVCFWPERTPRGPRAEAP